MNKGLDFVVILLIWGGLMLFLLQSLPADAHKSDNRNFSASIISLFKNQVKPKEIKGIISVFDKKGDFKKASVFFSRKIDIYDIKISPTLPAGRQGGPKLIFAGSDYGLFVSRDNGFNWKSFSDNEKKIGADAKIYKILFGPSDYGHLSVFQGNKGIIYQSRDNFSSLTKILEFSDVAINDFDITEKNLYVGLSDQTLVVYSLKNQSFKILSAFNSPISRLKAETDNLIYLTLKSGGFFISRDSGLSFEKMKFLENYRGADRIYDFAVDPVRNKPPQAAVASLIYAATEYGLIRSRDFGKNWQVFDSLPKDNQKIFKVIGRNDEILAVNYDKIYKSRDAGLSWRILYPEIEDSRMISALAVGEDIIIVGSRK